jgi:hypothetical protein
LGGGVVGNEITAKEFDALIAEMNEPYVDYWAALGKFVHLFSGVEALLQALVFKLAGVSDEIGKAMFPGLRVDVAKDVINRLLDAKGDVAAKERLREPFAQLGQINAVRNNLIHWGAQDTGNGLQVSNERIAHTKEKLRRYTVSAEMLADMREDLATIEWSILRETIPAEYIRGFDAKAVASFAQRPWRYTPPPQSPPPKPPRSHEARR